MAKAKKHYVNNKELFEAMVAYQQSIRDAQESGDDRPPVPEYVGQCLVQIANRLSHKPNFINYSYRDEMISDGIENCITYINNFNPEKSKNPFAYFTQIIYYAFLRRIQKEKKQLYIKHKALEDSVLLDKIIEHAEHADGPAPMPTYIDLDNPYMVEFVQNFEQRQKEKKQRRKGLDRFSEDEELFNENSISD
jgi:hypothetical protein